MKGFTRDHKFIPMTDYKKVTRKSRDQKAKTQGVVIRKARAEPSSIFLRFMKENPKFSAVSGYDKLKDHPKVFRNSAGSFTQALWDGDIEKAIQRADPVNREALEKILFEKTRKARTVSLPKFHREKLQEDGLVKFWAESSDSKTVASLIQSKDFAEEMEIRITLPDFETVTVRGSKDIMDDLTFEEFLDKVNMHLERQELMRKAREPFPTGERRPSNLGDQDVIDAVKGKKLTQSDLIAMQRATRNKGELSDEDFKRRQEIVRKLEDLKHNRDKIAVRKINPDNTSQFNKKSRALGKANDKLNRQKEIYKKEFGLKDSEIQW